MIQEGSKIVLRTWSLINFNDKFLAEKVIRVINSYGNDFIPDIFGALKPLKKKYVAENIDDIVDVWLNSDNNELNSQRGYLKGSLIMEKKSP